MNRNSFLERPWVQKQISKVAAYTPRQNEILQLALGDPAMKDYARYLKDIQTAAQAKDRDRTFALGVRRSDVAYNDRVDLLRNKKKSDQTAEKLGYGNIAVSGALGLGDLLQKRSRANTIRKRAELLRPKTITS